MNDRACRTAASLAVWVAWLAATGCGGSGTKTDTSTGTAATPPTQSQAAQQVSDGASKVAEGAKQMARGAQQMMQAAAKPVDFDELKALLPEVGGWKRTEVTGEMISLPVPYATATARYTHDTSQIELEIKDSALSQIVLGPVTMFMSSGFSEKSDEGYKKAVTFSGSPGYEEWNQPAQTAELTVIVAGRFVVHGRGRRVANVEPVRAVVQAVGLSKLARLK